MRLLGCLVGFGGNNAGLYVVLLVQLKCEDLQYVNCTVNTVVAIHLIFCA